MSDPREDCDICKGPCLMESDNYDIDYDEQYLSCGCCSCCGCSCYDNLEDE